MPKTSAGLLVFRNHRSALEVLLAHPGGPFWVNRDEGAWTIPKGELDPGEDPEEAARREFREETGIAIERGELRSLGSLVLPSRKRVLAWAVEGELDPGRLRSNTFLIEWPPGSGQRQEFPEVDRVEWFTLDVARKKIAPAQAPFLDELERIVGER